MASFKCKSKDEIAPAVLITQLTPPQRSFTLSARETWNCAFSPDDIYFAWSCGNRIVVVVPWKCSISYSWNEILSVENRHCQIKKPIILDTGYLVWSVAFGVVTCNKIFKNRYVFWKRLCFSQYLILVTAHNNGRIRIWDIQTGNLILELIDDCSIITDLSFSPDGSLILLSSSYDGTLKLWDLNDNGNRFGTLSMNNKPVYLCAWSPNAKLMVSVGMDKVAYIWDMIEYCVKLKLEGHHYDIIACSLSPNSCLVSTASWDTRAILWDAETSLMLKCFGYLFPSPHLIYAGGQNGIWIRGVSFSPDDSHFVTVAKDRYKMLWMIMKYLLIIGIIFLIPEIIKFLLNIFGFTSVGIKKNSIANAWHRKYKTKPGLTFVILQKTAMRPTYYGERMVIFILSAMIVSIYAAFTAYISKRNETSVSSISVVQNNMFTVNNMIIKNEK